MQPYHYLEQAGATLDSLDDSNEIEKVLDELEVIYELLDPEFKDLADDLIGRLNGKLKDAS